MDSLERELANLEFDTSVRMLAEDIRVGRLPSTAGRAANRIEIASGISFLAHSDDVAQAAAALAAKMGEQRQRFIAILRADLAALGSVDAIVARLQDHQALGLGNIPGAAELLTSTGNALVPILNELLGLSASRVRDEARRQGVDIDSLRGLTPVADQMVTRQAKRLTSDPMVGVVKAETDQIIKLASNGQIDELLGLFDLTARDLSEKPLLSLASQAGASMAGIGRQEAVESSGRRPKSIYASELLDTRTCGYCRMVDGKNYATIAEMRVDYPSGIYRNCEGGLLCRGLPVIVWDNEVD